MTYNRKKINTKGEKAPNGYHYMAGDSLMSDEEHEKRYGKSFTYSKNHTKSSGCGGGCTIVQQVANTIEVRSSPTAVPVTLTYPNGNVITPSSISIPPGFPTTAVSWSEFGTISKFQDKIFVQIGGAENTQGPGFNVFRYDLIELQLHPDCTATIVRYIDHGNGSWTNYNSPTSWEMNNPVCAMGPNKLLGAANSVSGVAVDSSCYVYDIVTNTINTSLLFTFPQPQYSTNIGSMVFIPSSNTIAIIEQNFGASDKLHHFDMSGNLIDSINIPSGVQGATLGAYCYNGDVYTSNLDGTVLRFNFDATTGVISFISTVVTGGSINFNGPMDAASSPACCDAPPIVLPPKPNGWDCEITAYQSTPPYAPIYGCVEKFTPQVGQFPTQQLCIASHCGSPPLATVQCSRCNNGSAVSNVFQGTTCPPGWQPASLGDPCKPPTGPTPIDPVLSTPRVPGSTGRTDSSSY